MILEIMGAFWFFLPAGIANMAPTLVKWIPLLDYPVDFGINIKGRPLLGKNKTFRGYLSGIIFAIGSVYIQKAAMELSFFQKYSIVDYNSINILMLGFLLGFGALFGDSVKSFFKRRKGIAPGKRWIPFDQIDWIIGANVLALTYVKIPLEFMFISILIFGGLHPLINYIGYSLRIKKNKF